MTDPKKIKWLEQPQVTALLSVIKHPRDAAIFTVGYWRGLRASEVGKLLISDWNPMGRLYVRRAKGSNSAEYLVSEGEKRVIKRWLSQVEIPEFVYGDDTHQDRQSPLFPSEQGYPIGRSRLDQLMKQYGPKAGLPPDLCHFHVLRHSIAVYLVDQGQPLQIIKDWLGHKSITSTLVYAQLRNPTRDRASQAVYDVSEQRREKIKWVRKKR